MEDVPFKKSVVAIYLRRFSHKQVDAAIILCYNQFDKLTLEKWASMTQRPVLEKTFRDFYYLREELVDFCRKNDLPVSGGKIELPHRSAYFLDTGKILPVSTVRKRAAKISYITKENRD